MFIVDKYENYSASEYYDVVTLKPEGAAEAVYGLLKHRLSRALGRVFELHGYGLSDHYDDTIDDFFLYLYDRGDGLPFAIFESIREKQAFFGWIVGTYRNFLLNKAKEEMRRKEMMEWVGINPSEEECFFSDETLMCIIATAVAHADQVLPPRNRFIFYRMLLTILDPKLAVPQDAMAGALGMHPVTYRVCVNRLRTRLLNDVMVLEQGRDLPLDPVHLVIRNQMVRNFDHLYEALLPRYEAALQTLSAAFEINMLRNSYGPSMHEELEYSYPHIVDVREFYKKLKS